MDVCGVQCSGQWECVYKNIRPESARSIDPSGQMGQEVMGREIKQSETVV